PFEQDFPEVIEDTLENGPAVTVRFNRRGTLLAAGCSDGTIVIWDFDTRGVSRTLIGHVKTVTSLSSVFIAALYQEKPVIVDFSNGIKRSAITGPINDEGSAEQNVTSISTSTPAPTQGLGGSGGGHPQWTLVVTFDRQGKKIFMGSNRGQISVVDTETRSVLYNFRPTTSAIKSIQFSRKGKEIVVNANDRMIRLFAIKDDGPPEQMHKFQDLVDRIQWNQCCFSSDADYVIGGSGHQTKHNIYIWDKIGGNLVKILEGPKEPLEDIAWHPIRPIVASVSSYGTIHIWATNYQENWSAFAPDFKELEENIDYEEREDEFDIVPEEEASKRKHEDEDVLIDVTTIEKVNPFNDSDSEDGQEETFYLPLLPSDQQDQELLHQKHLHLRHHHRHGHRYHSNHHGYSHVHRQHRHVQGQGSSLKYEILSSPSERTHDLKYEVVDHMVESERERDRERHYDSQERDQDRDRDHDHGERHHRQKRGSDDEDMEMGDAKHGHAYENGSSTNVNGHGHGHGHGHGYDRDQRKRLDDQQSSPRSIKRQR
ncbi:hypothetical protein BGZ65_003483, partial [Modicella reniformis]